MSRLRFLIVGYGGTISMVIRDNKVVPAENVTEIMNLLPNVSEYAELELKVLTNKDSTNVNHTDWTYISQFIADHMDEYDGFLITHGTNTLAYTASALALSFGLGLKKPIVLTGSQLPLTVFGSDARFNFENSIKVLVQACTQSIAEVMIVFNDVILRGARTVKVSESAFRAFHSPAIAPIGEIRSTGVHFFLHTQIKHTESGFILRNQFIPGVLSIDLTPGQLPELFEQIVTMDACRGIILKSHGAGSVPTDGLYNFLPFIEKTVSIHKKPVIVSTKFLGGNSIKEINDECAVEAVEAGAISSGDLTDVMTEVKLMWVLACGATTISEIRTAMLHDEVGEISTKQV